MAVVIRNRFPKEKQIKNLEFDKNKKAFTPAEITHGGPALALHLVASVLLEELLLTRHTRPEHGFSHGVLQLHPVRHVAILLHLVTGQGNVVVLLTQPTRLLPALRVTATNNLKQRISQQQFICNFVNLI